MNNPLLTIGKRCLTASLTLVLALAFAGAAPAETLSADSLRSAYGTLGQQLSHNPFGRELVLKSSETSKQSSGDIYAVVNHPFAAVDAALSAPEHWCDILILHLNTKYCSSATAAKPDATLTIYIGKKFDQPLADASRVDLAFHVAAHTSEYLAVDMHADEGPVGTSNYHIDLEAIPVSDSRTFLHFRYAYDYGFVGRMAMQAYLATTGRDKVGFTVVGKRSDGEPDYIGGVRGLVERNTMRYYLAIDSYLAASAAGPEQLEKRLHTWFSSTEGYARQLHEIPGDAYFEMKRKEVVRQQTPKR